MASEGKTFREIVAQADPSRDQRIVAMIETNGNIYIATSTSIYCWRGDGEIEEMKFVDKTNG